MDKAVGYTYAIATRNPKQTFVFCEWFTTMQLAIDYAIGEVNDRSEYDVDFILIREGVTGKDDPIIWDSRKDYKSEPVITPLQQLRTKVDELHTRNEFDTLCYDELVDLIKKLS